MAGLQFWQRMIVPEKDVFGAAESALSRACSCLRNVAVFQRFKLPLEDVAQVQGAIWRKAEG